MEEEKIFAEINNLRKDPRSFIPILEQQKKYYKNTEYRNNKHKMYLQTKEGYSAVQDAIEFLKQTKPVDPLSREVSLNQSAKELVDHIGPEGIFTPKTKEMEMSERVRRHYKEKGGMAENVSFGWGDGLGVVLQLLIDDGVPSRGHRRNIFKSNWKRVGIACGAHKSHNHCSVVIFVGEQEKQDMSKYKLEKDKWPEDAVSLNTKIQVKSDGKVRTVVVNYEFEMANGEIQTEEKIFNEKID